MLYFYQSYLLLTDIVLLDILVNSVAMVAKLHLDIGI